MNIFFLSKKVSRCARWHCDKHVVKMILETAQLLYTAHWVLEEGEPDFSSAPCRMGGEVGYKPIRNVRHPSALWVRESLRHYMWLADLGVALCAEYRHRFGKEKEHRCEEHIFWLWAHPPAALADHGWRQPPQAMPDIWRRHDSVAAYRAYYLGGKAHILTYSGRAVPHWIHKRRVVAKIENGPTLGR